MPTLMHYIKNRHFCKVHGFGTPPSLWLWLDAVLHGTRRWLTLNSPFFNAWCRKVDQVFLDSYDFQYLYTETTGRDAWIDAYQSGLTPEEAAASEVAHWDS